MPTSVRSSTLDRLLTRHRRDAEEIRAMHGDPVEFLGRVVRAGFTREELEEAYRESIRGGNMFDADEPDER